ncbi:hypothetical protein [Mycolicibacterium moriokaense]|nr:hypothetical protein [Mycolicibacterium moriokaense]
MKPRGSHHRVGINGAQADDQSLCRRRDSADMGPPMWQIGQ